MRRSMHFGTRNVRSAGRGSGSIEMTLPVELAVLEGVTCRVALRDSLVPEVVLQPDLRFLLPLFETTWDRLNLGLEPVGEIGGFSEGDYVLGLFPAAGVSGRPGLAYADALLVARDSWDGEEAAVGDATRAIEAFARMIESMAIVAGTRLGLPTEIAAMFGNQIAYVVTGAPAGTVDMFARSLLSDMSPEVGWCRRHPLAKESWLSAQARLAGVYDRFAAWDGDPAALARARESWYRAHRFETRTQSSGA